MYSDTAMASARPAALPPIKAVEVDGTTIMSDGHAYARPLGSFRDWLKARHPGAKVSVACSWRPERFGEADVALTPRDRLEPGCEAHAALSAETAAIGRAWRDAVGFFEE